MKVIFVKVVTRCWTLIARSLTRPLQFSGNRIQTKVIPVPVATAVRQGNVLAEQHLLFSIVNGTSMEPSANTVHWCNLYQAPTMSHTSLASISQHWKLKAESVSSQVNIEKLWTPYWAPEGLLKGHFRGNLWEDTLEVIQIEICW